MISIPLCRAFTQTLNLINAAEVHHRMRILRNIDMVGNRQSPLPMREDSIAGTIDKLLESEKDGAAVSSNKRKL